MANFEGLIRGAIAAKNATTAAQRLEIYQSSRSALYRLIEGNRSLTVETAMQEQQTLEAAIAKIENEFAQPAPAPMPKESQVVPEPPVSVPEVVEEQVPQFEYTPEPEPVAVPENDDPLAELRGILEQDAPQDAFEPIASNPDVAPQVQAEAPAQPISPQPVVAPAEVAPSAAQPVPPQEPVFDTQPQPDVQTFQEPAPMPAPEQPIYDDNENMPLEFARRRKKQKFLGWFVAIVVILALLAWLAYYIYMGVVSGTLFGLNQSKPAQNPNAPSNQATSAEYVTILQPGDLSAMITAGRGKAEIVTELNLEMIRLSSVRDDQDRSQPAKPILLRLKPGVLEQISGKNVTFEIYGKSASSSPAQFTVKCQFGALGSCGRKRFRVGLQPEASIFAFDLGVVTDLNMKAYIAISTDTTAAAAATGKGDAIDIVYARLRANN